MENNFILIENSYLICGKWFMDLKTVNHFPVEKWFSDLEYGLIFYRTVTSSLNLVRNMLHNR
jgi:hypothetical protein